MDQKTSDFPTLYKRNSKGQIQYWSIRVQRTPMTYAFDIITEYGLQGGKEQQAIDTITEGKNIGKANETTPLDQALAEAASRWRKQQDRKGYVENLVAVDEDVRPGAEPMLAHRYDKYPDKIQFPCAAQPKLDGHRCIAVFDDGVVKLFSRQRKQITGLPHIEQAIQESMISLNRTAKIVLDGELYNHDYKDNFEELTSHIRNESPKEGYKAVQYHLYDIVNSTAKFEFRYQALSLMASCMDDAVLKLVETVEIPNDERALAYFKACRAKGYEGAILRNLDGLYVGKRSYDLQKVKEFVDAEFEIVGVEEGRGKMKGHAIFVCKTPEGKEFRAKMMGSMDSLIEYFNNADQYIGRYVTVQFQEYTKDNVPRFPVAVRFRGEEAA